MRRIFCIPAVLLVLLAICGCAKTSVAANQKVTLTFIYGEKNISVTLTDEEAAEVTATLDGKKYDPVFSGVPSCGFDKNISLSVDGRVYAVARDGCSTVQDLGSLKYFTISQEETAYIHSLFEKYGGKFPCV